MLTQPKTAQSADREHVIDRLKRLAGRNDEMPVAVPPVDIFESDNNEVVLEIEMAGVNKDTVHLEVQGDRLEISGKTNVPDLPKEYTPIYSERRKRQYQRTFVLGAELQADRIRANYDNGLLRLTIPKVEKPKPKIITVE